MNVHGAHSGRPSFGASIQLSGIEWGMTSPEIDQVVQVWNWVKRWGDPGTALCSPEVLTSVRRGVSHE